MEKASMEVNRWEIMVSRREYEERNPGYTQSRKEYTVEYPASWPLHEVLRDFRLRNDLPADEVAVQEALVESSFALDGPVSPGRVVREGSWR